MAKATTKKTKKTHGRPMQLSRTAGTLSRNGSQGGTSQAGHDVVVEYVSPTTIKRWGHNPRKALSSERQDRLYRVLDHYGLVEPLVLRLHERYKRVTSR